MDMQFDKHKIFHIRGVDHPESLSVGPEGELYTTGTGCQVYRIDLQANVAIRFAATSQRCLGQAVDASGNLYCAHTTDGVNGGDVLRITPDGHVSTYATGPHGRRFTCANYPVFDAHGNMYLSDSGDWSSSKATGAIHRIPPGGGCAQCWYPGPVDTPNGMALDAMQKHLYYVETWGASICRIAINPDGSAGEWERVVHMPRHVPDGIAFDDQERLWIACHRPDAVCVYDLKSRQMHTFVDDWMGHYLRGPTDIAFAGPRRDIMVASSLDNLCIHRLDHTGVTGLPLHHPQLPNAS